MPKPPRVTSTADGGEAQCRRLQGVLRMWFILVFLTPLYIYEMYLNIHIWSWLVCRGTSGHFFLFTSPVFNDSDALKYGIPGTVGEFSGFSTSERSFFVRSSFASPY